MKSNSVRQIEMESLTGRWSNIVKCYLFWSFIEFVCLNFEYILYGINILRVTWLKGNKVNWYIAVIFINKTWIIHSPFTMSLERNVAHLNLISLNNINNKNVADQKEYFSLGIIKRMFKIRSCLLPWSTLRCNICEDCHYQDWFRNKSCRLYYKSV